VTGRRRNTGRNKKRDRKERIPSRECPEGGDAMYTDTHPGIPAGEHGI